MPFRALAILGFAVLLPQQPASLPPAARYVVPRIELRIDDNSPDVKAWARAFIVLVDRNKWLPAEAAAFVGHVTATFDVNPDGKIVNLIVAPSGGDESLVTAAREAIGRASDAMITHPHVARDRMPVSATLYFNEVPPQASTRSVEPPPGVYLQSADGVTAPRLIHGEHAGYTADAMRAKIQGRILIGAVVDVDGTVRDAQVLRPLDPWLGLDEEALRVAKMWTFKPGTREGEAVPVWITVEMTFTLR